MNKPKDKGYYNRVHTPETLRKFYKGLFKERNDVLLNMIKSMLPDKVNVLDIAAGSSYIAEELIKSEKVVSYTWNDFNPMLVDLVSKRINDYRFKIEDFDAEDQTIDFSNFNLVICISLEHIVRDFELLDRIKEGTFVAISSPNFGGTAHVRHFETCDDFENRYSKYINVLKSKTITNSNNRKMKFVIVGIRNKRVRK
jgi:2-polyprenyl-3-methyl-5-hydroxy-6-metoxy-1,4-benzoquinol methylase